MCSGLVSLASVSWRARFVNPQDRNFSRRDTFFNIKTSYSINILIMNLDETLCLTLDEISDNMYSYNHSLDFSTRTMNDYESSYIWDYEISCHDCLDEMYVSYNIQDTYDLDDDYARDSTDYQELAYRHYA